jgi:enoyl-CoA hydratase/carnithine racemase
MHSLSVADAIATITIADASALTRHDESAGRSLLALIHECDDRDDVKAVILRTESVDFCQPAAGQASDPAMWEAVYAGSAGLYQGLCYAKKVTITAIQGQCTGAGSMLVLCSDLTVAAPSAQLTSPFDDLPEANLVLAALTMRLNRAKAWMLDGAPLSAAAACTAGLVNVVAANPVAEAGRLARRAARMPLDGIAMSKLMMETVLDAQGVGQEFDMAGHYRSALAGAR